MTFIEFDIRTLSSITVLFAFITAFGLLTFSLHHPRFKGIGISSVGLALTGVGFGLIFLRHYIPTFFSVIISNSLIPIGFIFVNHGICRFRNLKAYSTYIGIVFVLVNAAMLLQFLYVTPSVPMRIVSVSTTVGILIGLCCWNISRRYGGNRNAPTALTAIGLAFTTLYMFFRSWWAANEQILQDFMDAGMVHSLAFLAMIFTFMCIAYGLVWIASESLQNDLRQSELIISATPDLILLVDEHGVYKMANKAALEILNTDEDSLIGKSSAEFFSESFYSTITLPNLKLALSGEIGMTSTWIELPNSSPKYMALHYHPVPSALGDINLVAISGRDITERRIGSGRKAKNIFHVTGHDLYTWL
ncbi:MAG: PAS domain-containing protein [Desulfovibrio sp.]